MQLSWNYFKQMRIVISHIRWSDTRPPVLPSFINVIYHERAEDEQDEERNEHVVDCSDVVHFKQFTANVGQANHELIIYI